MKDCGKIPDIDVDGVMHAGRIYHVQGKPWRTYTAVTVLDIVLSRERCELVERQASCIACYEPSERKCSS